MISILLFTHSRSANAFPLLIGLFLSSNGAPVRVLDSLNYLGISVSYRLV
jgi:hypothetical protein